MFNSWYEHGVGKNWFKNLEYSLCITLKSALLCYVATARHWMLYNIIKTLKQAAYSYIKKPCSEFYVHNQN